MSFFSHARRRLRTASLTVSSSASWIKRGGFLAIIFSLIFGSLVPLVPSQAASTDYTAALISLNVPAHLSPNQVAQVEVTFKNIGRAAWYQGGKNFTSLYRWDPARKVELASAFASAAWETSSRASRLPVGTVVPGTEVTLAFPIKAPAQTGTYREAFTLTAEDAAWVKYGTFVMEITVGDRVNATMASISTPAPVTPTAPAPTLPVSSGEWQAQLVERGGSEWQIEAGEQVTIQLGFKNTGTKPWKRDGINYVSLYATDAGTKERKSGFYESHWISRSQVVTLQEPQVLPGQVGHVEFVIRAPQAPGLFQEQFSLAVENLAWVNGGSVTLPIRIPVTSEFIATAPPGFDLLTPTNVVPSNTPSNSAYMASLMLRSVQTLLAEGDARKQVTFGFKNIGTTSWNSRSVQMKQVTPVLSGTDSSIRDTSWNSPIEAARLSGATKPGEVAFISFTLKTPTRRGDYHALFQLVADDQLVSGGDIDIPITVTADGALEYHTPIPVVNTGPAQTLPSPSTVPSVNIPAPDAIPLTGDPSSLPSEPLIRVGLFKTTDNKMMIRAKYAPIQVLQNGSSVCRLDNGQLTTVTYDRTNRVYKLEGGPCTGQSTSWYVFKAEDGTSPIEIADFSRPLSWLPGANDNTFRAQLELRYTPKTDQVWVINELPIELYLKGIAETSNSSPQQFQRTLLVAARTYAMYHVQRGTKHADEFYTVDATYDQVYRGYGAEARDGNVVAAIDATRGQIVTYQGRLAITPYYSRSDGRTRSWGEVWGGGSNYPWLVSVPVPWDAGKTLWGHGVGLSASGALGMANDGKAYDEILRYFFQGTELRRAYK